jgi:tetratricopeptide (TPR) repeat protein
MSLLLEALKKAERAKEEAAQRRAKTEPEAIAAAAAAQAAAPAEAPPPLPDIRQPLEIVREEAPQPEPALTLTEEKPRPAPIPKAEAAASDRAAARKVFEAKFREPNPRLPFFITMGALGVFALGTIVYFWMQLRPPAPLVNLNPKPAAGDQVATAAPQPPAPTAPAPSAAKSTIPGLPPAATAPAPAIKAEPAPRIETPILKPPVRPAAPPRSEPAPAEVTTSRPAAPQVHAKVSTGYAAYLAGDLPTARSEYEQALREEPGNRDALLGLAALDVRAGRFEAAEGAYQRLLRADPRDPHAHAALIALRGGRFDPAAAESRVKSMLAENPGAHVLNFTLGNQFAQQGRWAEAQQEFFKAFAAEPENADFAYNLAVSLDHLRQPRLALDYYQRALALAKARGASFDTAAAEARAAQLR